MTMGPKQSLENKRYTQHAVSEKCTERPDMLSVYAVDRSLSFPVFTDAFEMKKNNNSFVLENLRNAAYYF